MSWNEPGGGNRPRDPWGGKDQGPPEKKKYTDSESLESSLETFFSEYDNVIKSIDFSIDTPKVKHDVQKRTRTFLKKGI